MPSVISVVLAVVPPMSKPIAWAMPMQAGEMPGADHAGDRPGLHHGDRIAPRLRDRHGAAVRAHDGDLAGEVLLARESLEARQIARHARAHIGVERGGRGALVLAELAQDLVAQRHEQGRRLAAQRLAGRDLVRRVGVGMEEAHRDRLDAARDELARERWRSSAGSSRRERLAGRGHALGHLEGEVARHQRARAMEEQVERVGPVAAAERVDVAEARRGDERGPGAAALQHGVDRDGRAVQQLVHGGDVATGERERGGGPLGRVGRHRQRLRRDDGAVVEPDQVREGPADIDADDAQVYLSPLGRGRRAKRVG